MTKTTETARTFSETTETTADTRRSTAGAATTGLLSQWPQSSQPSSQEASQLSQPSQLSRLLAMAIVAVAALFAGGAFASTGYFTEESLKTADMTGISEGVERTLKAFDGRISRAKALARKLSGVEADMVASRVELAQRLRDYVAQRHRAGTQEMELLAWQGAEELRLFYAYFAAEQRRHADRAKNNRRPVVLNVRDFGAKGDGGTDDGPAFRAALAAAAEKCGKGAPVTLKVPRGTYLVRPDPKAKVPETFTARSWREYDENGVNPAVPVTRPVRGAHDMSQFHLFAVGMERFTLQGEEGAELRFADATKGGIGFDCSTETLVKDLTISYAERAFTQGTVVGVETDPAALVVRIDEGYPAPDLPRFLNAPSRRLTLHDDDGLFARTGTGRLGEVVATGKDTFRLVRPDGMKKDPCWNAARVGSRFTALARYSECVLGHPVYFMLSSFSGAENVVVHDSPGQVFLFSASYAMRLVNCHVRRRDARDLLASDADMMICTGLFAAYVADCSAEFGEDDGMNFCGSTTILRDMSADRTSFNGSDGFLGDSAFQLDGVTGRVKAFLRRGKTSDRLAGRAAADTITEKDLAKKDTRDWLAENAWVGKAGEIKADRLLHIPGMSGGVVKNTRFFNLRGMGVQVHCANMLLDGLSCRHLTGPGASINPLFGWGMMFNVHDVLVRNAAVEDTSCGFLVKPICVQPGVTLTHSQIHGIEFAGNAFKLGKGVEPYAVANADDIVVDGQALVPFNRDVAAEPSDAAKRGAENFNRRMLEVSGGTPGGRRVVILGNSITLAARHDEIGWKHDCGMAASAPEKDYVHLFLKGLAKADPRGVEYRVKNIAGFERDWATYDLKRLDQLAAFRPDLLVVAIGENVANFPDGTAAFEARIAELIGRFRKGNPSCKVVVRGVFWPNPVKDAALSAVARRLGCVWVMASDLGARKECTAEGLFEHKGIAAHPGDVGMAALAERLVAAAKPGGSSRGAIFLSDD